jgi:protein-tyrosine phosphatase
MERRIALDGCLNFRDLGGYPSADGRLVRWRTLFRSDTITEMSAADVARLRDELSIGEVIDLRSSAELEREGRGRLAAEPVRFHHVPLIESDATMRRMRDAGISLAERYLALAEETGERISRILTVVAEAEGPVLYHCAAGKDRTGLVSAVLLGVLGVAEAVIALDYAASETTLEAIIERLMRQEGYRQMIEALPPDTRRAGRETMEEFLAVLTRRYGSVEGYTRAAGVSAATLAALRERLLCDRPGG